MKPWAHRFAEWLTAVKSFADVLWWLCGLVAVAIAWGIPYWAASDVVVPYPARFVLGIVLGILSALIVAVWGVNRRDQRSSSLVAENAQLKSEIADLKKPKHNRVTGEHVVDGILWSYVGDIDTGEWIKCEPLCPECKTRLCVDDVSSMLVLEDRDRRVRYYCDLPTCGKFDRTFGGSMATVEHRAYRHILSAEGR